MTTASETPTKTLVSVTKAWFEALQESRGKRADLRRCKALAEVYYCQGFFELYYPSLTFCQTNQEDWAKRIACLAGILAAGPREWRSGEKTMGQALAIPGGDIHALSPLRFRRLLCHKSMEDLFPPLRRACQLIKFKFPSNQLVQSIQYWGPKTRKDWALDYYQPQNKAIS